MGLEDVDLILPSKPPQGQDSQDTAFKGRKIYFGLWFQRLWLAVGQLLPFGPVARLEHQVGGTWLRRACSKQTQSKEPGPRLTLLNHGQSDPLPLIRPRVPQFHFTTVCLKLDSQGIKSVVKTEAPLSNCFWK